MTTITEKITVCSEDGDNDYPCTLEIRMDGSKPTCPVTFYMEDKPVFSMASDEIPAFCEALKRMECAS
jgi:hypothetical protein